ncbi:MAG: methyltransferase domain-containing protein [Bryobacterales bacterium]|nr:methyltransferase domain-containing protein [Bryobacterales bacterium]
MSSTADYGRKMRQDWDQRAAQNARHFIADGVLNWSEEDFYASGRTTVAQDILTDMENICQGRDPKSLRVLELGCGAGRVTRALAEIFGHVSAFDVSPNMVALARAATAACPNVSISETDGLSLSAEPASFDFAYSCCVFHHVSSRPVIHGLVTEIGRLLKPGALFKFEVQGCELVRPESGDTWLGIPFSLAQATEMAAQCGFELRYHIGEGEERFWLWFFRLP